MSKEVGSNEIRQLYPNSNPKILGGYKSEGWAKRILNKMSNPAVEFEAKNIALAKAIVKIQNGSFYPAFLSIDISKRGLITGAYFVSERKDQFDLLPLDIAFQFIRLPEEEFFPLRYKTLVRIEDDHYQKNWPDFS